jgi:NAD-dependent dihydropyrimidine dehydrogenase PreA subunit
MQKPSRQEKFVALFKLPPAMVPYIDYVATEQEMDLVIALGDRAMTGEQIAELLGMSPSQADTFLTRAYQREVVKKETQDGRTTYRPSTFYSRMDVLAMFENEKWRGVPDEARQALHEWQLQAYIDLWMPAIQRIREDPDAYIFVKNRDVLLLEEALEMVEAADDHVITRCDCRSIMMSCDFPVEEACVRLGEGARLTHELGQGRRVSKEEMKALVIRTDKAGLIHTGVRNWHGHEDEFWGLCNCCTCCCYPIKTGMKLGIAKQAYPRVHHVAARDLQKCGQCGVCIKRCQFGAFYRDGSKVEVNGKLRKAVRFDADKCWGCGLCATACPEGAIDMLPLES